MNKRFELLVRGTEIAIVDTGKCKYCSEEFPLYDLEKEMLDKQGFSYPDFCPTCRFRMLYSYINDKHLYHRKDDLSGSTIVSVLTPEFSGTVYNAEEYKKMLADDFGLEFGRESKGDVFSDFKDLYREFPKPSKLIYPELENAEYASHLGWAKNVYMSFCVFVNCENICNSFAVIFDCRNVFSSFDVTKSSNIYNSGLVNSCHEIAFSYNIFDSSSLVFCRNMQTCQDCIFCCNQVNARYKIYNQQYTKEEYERIKRRMLDKMARYDGFEILEKEYADFLKKNLIDVASNVVNSTTVNGEKVYNSKNSVNVYGVPASIEDCVNLFATGGGKNLLNSVESGVDSQSIIGSCGTGLNSYGIYFCFAAVENCNNVYYCADIESCEECMFCVGLKHKKHCILNKQYPKEVYFQEKERIISNLRRNRTWGQFLGFDFSSFPYNDTLAYDYFKVRKVVYSDGTEQIIDDNAIGTVRIFENAFISKAELDLGGAERIQIKWRTREKEVNIPEGMVTIDAQDITDASSDESILNKAIICKISGRPFKIIKDELDFIRKRGFPLPRTHPELRMDTLISTRPLGQLFLGKSDTSGNDILTVFKGKSEFRVYSPEEYRDFMFS